MKQRHCYGATDNIILDFRARSGNATYIMGDSFQAEVSPQLSVRAIGTGAIIMPGVTIGAGAMVGAGAIVTADVQDGTVVVGNPARVIRQAPRDAH